MTRAPHIEHLPPAHGRSPRPPLLFVHGAFGGPWMWARNFAPWFSARGFECWSLGFRRAVAGAAEPGLDDYLADLESAAAAVGRPPVVVAHSLGALVAQMALGRLVPRALAMLAPAPPTGMVWSSLRLAIDAPSLWSRVILAVDGTGVLDRAFTAEALFAPGAPPALVRGTHARLGVQPARPLLEAQWPRIVPGAARLGVPALAIAAGADRLVPADSVARTARFHRAVHRVVEGCGHALMLDRGWETAARYLLEWLDSGALRASA